MLTRFFKAAVCTVWIAFIPVSAWANNVLTEQDFELIAQGKEIVSSTSDEFDLSGLINRHMEQAQQQAIDLVEQMSATNPTMKAMSEIQRKKEAYRAHGTLVFVSLSLGEQGLRDILLAVSGDPDAVVVLRGIPEGMSLGDGLRGVQKLAAAFDPVPNIILDPSLFKKYAVTAVPTIVLLEQRSTVGLESRNVLARVEGLSDPTWLRDAVSRGDTGDLGIRGPVAAISEPDLIEVMKDRAAKIDWEEKKEQAIARYWSSQTYLRLSSAIRSRSRTIDPSVYITEDITAPNGTVIASKGDVINPLDMRPFSQALVIFDPLDQRQMELIDQMLPHIKQMPNVQRVTFIATRMDRDKGWDGYEAITDHFEAPVYVLTPELKTRFALEHTPSVITSQGDSFIVRELTIQDIP